MNAAGQADACPFSRRFASLIAGERDKHLLVLVRVYWIFNSVPTGAMVSFA